MFVSAALRAAFFLKEQVRNGLDRSDKGNERKRWMLELST
jgi:hypothetical protein